MVTLLCTYCCVMFFFCRILKFQPLSAHARVEKSIPTGSWRHSHLYNERCFVLRKPLTFPCNHRDVCRHVFSAVCLRGQIPLAWRRSLCICVRERGGPEVVEGFKGTKSFRRSGNTSPSPLVDAFREHAHEQGVRSPKIKLNFDASGAEVGPFVLRGASVLVAFASCAPPPLTASSTPFDGGARRSLTQVEHCSRVLPRKNALGFCVHSDVAHGFRSRLSREVGPFGWISRLTFVLSPSQTDTRERTHQWEKQT